MPHLTKKKIKGHLYYYARECQRVNGKVKTIWQKYLGTVEQILRRAEGEPAEPTEIHLTDAGEAAALYALAEELGIRELIDKHIPKREQGPSVGQYMMISAINRCMKPCGKMGIPEWMSATPLLRWLKQPAEMFDSQGFWNHMKMVTRENIRTIETELARCVTGYYNLTLRTVLFDETNYYTFIHTFNERCTLPQRGKNKQKRNDLRQVGLALLVDAENQLPLFHDVYEGNRPDSKEFASIVDEMAGRLKEVREGCEGITLIMDKGQNSKANIEKLNNEEPLHFIGSLKPTDHQQLLDVPLKNYKEQIDREGWKVYRTEYHVFGDDYTVVITYNDELLITQKKTLWREVEKAHKKLSALQMKLRHPPSRGRKLTKSATEKKVGTILKARHMKDLFSVSVYETKAGIRMSYKFKRRAATRLSRRLFGKTILFTDQSEWTTKEIVESYHAQYKIEDVFRLSKDPNGVSWFPMYHWTDHNIRVHAFYCMIGLLLMGVLRIKLREAGIEMTPERALKHLQGITEVARIYPDKSQRITTNTVTPTQKKLYDLLNLQTWLPPLLGTTP